MTINDFPHQGNSDSTQEWLVENGFDGYFANYKADSLIGLEEEDVFYFFQNNRSEGQRLWGLLNTARQSKMCLLLHPHDF